MFILQLDTVDSYRIFNQKTAPPLLNHFQLMKGAFILTYSFSMTFNRY